MTAKIIMPIIGVIVATIGIYLTRIDNFSWIGPYIAVIGVFIALTPWIPRIIAWLLAAVLELLFSD